MPLKREIPKATVEDKDMNDPKVSIIMACYNCEKTVGKALNSILDQTYQNWVMICCDDGSHDRTVEILKRYEQAHPGKFLVLQNESNCKLPYSLNHCLAHVETELVARMDADDWCDPTRLEKQVRYLQEHPEADLVGTHICVSDGEKRMASIVTPQYPVREDMPKRLCFAHATIMTYKRVYDALDGYSLDPTVLRVEDVDLWCRFFAAGFVGHNIQEELYTILEDEAAVKRRGLKARINEARTRCRGYKTMGFRGLVCYKPYLVVLRAFIPVKLYQKLHIWKLNRNKRG